MSNIYLSRVQLENFRTFGVFGLDLPAGPGLTLLVGTNGLGKSSFFDGLEWCLTGQIRRFTGHLTKAIKEKDYLTRREAPANSHRVSLTFGNAGTFTRSATTGPAAAAIIKLLKTENWGPIEDLGTYLAFTHFLGQAAQQRFTSRDPNQQWESLKGPSGIDRLEEVRSALRGAATRNAFRKRLDEEQTRIDTANVALTAWQEAMARLHHLRQAADAAGDLSGPSLETRVAALEASYAKIVGKPLDTSGRTTSERIVRLRQSATEQQALIQRRQAELAPLDASIDRYLAMTAASDTSGAIVNAANEVVAGALKAVADAEAATIEAQIRFEGHARTLRALEAEIAGLEVSRTSVEQIAALGAQIAEAEAERKRLSDALTTHRKELGEADAIIAAQQARQVAQAAANATDAAAKALLEDTTGLVSLEAGLRAKADASAAAEGAATEARRAVSELRLEAARVQAEIAENSRRLEEARRRASDVAAAVARIASHLSEHDDTCPVCSTHFAPGVLKSLAEAAARDQDAVLAPLQALHGEQSERAAQIAAELARWQALIDAAGQAAIEERDARETAGERRRRLASHLGVSVDDDLASVAASRKRDAEKALTIVIASLDAAAADVAAAAAARELVAPEIERLAPQVVALDNLLARLATTVRSLREALAADNRTDATLDELAGLLAERNAASSAERQARSLVEADLARLRAMEAGARQSLGAAQTEQTRVSAAVAAARRDTAALQESWAREGLAGSPAAGTLEQARSDLAKRTAELSALLDEQSLVVAASEAAARHQDLAELVAWMAREQGTASSNPEVHEAVLKQRVEDAQAAHRLTTATQEAVNAYTEQLKKEAEDFSTQFLVPLNDLIGDYNEALLSTPGESIRFNAAHNVDRTRFDMGLRYRDKIDQATYNTSLPPQIVLSEGQMAANGFSILCAASTAYPWSNWRALLLDDPLQHNDIIHAAAFADVMRNLVELQKYQLVMSSHDRAEGEFFARKFDAAGLPCTVVALTAPSKDGVKFDPPRYNSFARILMDEQIAQTG